MASQRRRPKSWGLEDWVKRDVGGGHSRPEALMCKGLVGGKQHGRSSRLEHRGSRGGSVTSRRSGMGARSGESSCTTLRSLPWVTDSCGVWQDPILCSLWSQIGKELREDTHEVGETGVETAWERHWELTGLKEASGEAGWAVTGAPRKSPRAGLGLILLLACLGLHRAVHQLRECWLSNEWWSELLNEWVERMRGRTWHRLLE